MSQGAARRDELAQALKPTYPVFAAVLAFSAVINVLALTSSLFMLQVYDRVLPSRSVPTLVALALITISLFAVQGVLEVIRSRVLARLGGRIHQALAPRVCDAAFRRPLQAGPGGDGQAPVRDLDSIRGFLASQAPVAIMDLPWIPIYLAFVFLLHPLLGTLATLGALALVAMAVATDLVSRRLSLQAHEDSAERQSLSATGARGAEVLEAMGFGRRVLDRWVRTNDRRLGVLGRASDVTGGLGGVSRTFRAVLQSAILGLGAYLVIGGEMTAGAIIASSITAARALAPVDMAIANWRYVVEARQARGRLMELFGAVPPRPSPLALADPNAKLSVEGLSVAAPGGSTPLISGVSFELDAGQVLGVVGASASGKSTLARALVGAWLPLAGTVRVDGAAIEQWSIERRGRLFGYLPQDVQLIDGTVAENISRFDPAADPRAILAAAEAADVHQMILRLPEGYSTWVGHAGLALSGGQRQRIGLARALYADPFVVVLDEPNSNLDGAGEQALTPAIRSIRHRGGIAIVIAHRPSAVEAADLIAIMADGQLSAFGPKYDVLPSLAQRPPPKKASSLAVVSNLAGRA